MLKKAPGTKDILAPEIYLWQEIEEISRKTFALYNYEEMRTPVFEEAALFNRSLGESAEIVQKQMFILKCGSDTYALRPEATASIVRSYIENNLDKTKGFSKFYYLGPMFRHERPQKGRMRQFHHIGCEAIGSNDPGLDVEVISLAAWLLKAFNIEGATLKINSLGCAEDRKGLADNLRRELKGKLKSICPDCQKRFKLNVLRVLDCKNEECREIIKGINIKEAHLCADCKNHFDTVKAGLGALKIDYKIDQRLVRGLDYYTGTVFEITHSELGSQDAIGAGGRYNGLVKELGGPDLGAIGFALGVERLLLATKSPSHQVTGKNLVYLIGLGDEAKKEISKLLSLLRESGVCADTDYENKSLKGAMRKANDLLASKVLIIGDDELRKGTVTLKDMASGEQKEVGLNEIIKELA